MNSWVPEHVAMMMDGNGRWGQEKGLTRSEGHYAGTKAMERVIDAGIELDIKILTLYAFSSENWSRPKDEVNYLMSLPVKYLQQKLPAFKKRNIKILVTGNKEVLPESTKKALQRSVSETENNDGLIVNFAFNYGGRDDILQAVQKVMYEIQQNNVGLDHVDEALFQQYLYTKELPDPDLVIRTGGEKRISNFLLWQCSLSELYFSDVYFPDFNRDLLKKAVHEVQERGDIHHIS